MPKSRLRSSRPVSSLRQRAAVIRSDGASFRTSAGMESEGALLAPRPANRQMQCQTLGEVDTKPESLAGAKQALTDIQAELSALAPDEVLAVNTDVPRAVSVALGAEPNIRAFESQIAEMLPSHERTPIRRPHIEMEQRTDVDVPVCEPSPRRKAERPQAGFRLSSRSSRSSSGEVRA